MNETTSRARTRPWDAADQLEDLDDVVACLEAAFEDGDPRIVAAAPGDIARSRAMTAVAAKAAPGRESLYKALSGDVWRGNPGLATILGVMNAPGLRLRPVASGPGPAGAGGTGWSDGFALPPSDLYVRSGGSAAHPARRASEYR